MSRFPALLASIVLSLNAASASAADIKQTDVYRRIRAAVDAVPAIDAHDHLRPFDEIPSRDQTNRGEGLTLRGVWTSGWPGLEALR